MALPMELPDDCHSVLKIPEILENIFSFSTVKDLTACRRVSKLWHDSSIKSWNKYATLYICKVVGTYTRSMSDFLDSRREQATLQLYSNVCISCNVFPDNVQTFNDFWSLCGHHVKTLKLEKCVFRNTDALRKLLFQYCPNLEQLEMRYVNFTGFMGEKRLHAGLPLDGVIEPEFGEHKNVKTLILGPSDVSRSRISWMEILTHFTSLEVLELTSQTWPRTVNELFTRLNEIRQSDDNKLKLRKIHARILPGSATKTSQPLFQLIVDPSIFLESLSIHFPDNDTATPSLSDILGTHGSTLKYLELDRHTPLRLDNSIPLLIRNQAEERLLCLRELILHSQVFTSFDFVELMPNLERLSIQKGADYMISNTSLHIIANIKLEKCGSLELGDSVSAEGLSTLGNILTKLETFKAPLDNSLFRWVCENLPNLVTLDLIKSKVNESGFTGFDDDLVTMINNSSGDYDVRPFSAARKANISWLKKLRSLSIESDGTYPKISLEFCAARYGIQEAPNLKRVKLHKISYNPEILLTSFRKYGRREYIQISN